jgi:iron-sulfur cluster assembly protein
MFEITPQAADAIRQTLARAPTTAGVRIALASSSYNGSGPALHVELALVPELRDEVVEADGLRIFLEPGAVAALDEKMLDAEVDAGHLRFMLQDRS